MLVELERGEVILRFEGQNYRPDDRLPDRRTAKEFVQGLSGVDEDLKRRFLDSKWRRSFRHPRSAKPERLYVASKVPPRVKQELAERAKAEGLTLSKYVARLLEGHVAKED